MPSSAGHSANGGKSSAVLFVEANDTILLQGPEVFVLKAAWISLCFVAVAHIGQGVEAAQGGQVAAYANSSADETELLCFQNGVRIVAVKVLGELQVEQLPSGRQRIRGRWFRSAYAPVETFTIYADASMSCTTSAAEQSFFFPSAR